MAACRAPAGASVCPYPGLDRRRHARAGSGTRYRVNVTRAADGLMPAIGVEKLCYLGAPTGANAPHPRSLAGAKLMIGPAFW